MITLKINDVPKERILEFLLVEHVEALWFMETLRKSFERINNAFKSLEFKVRRAKMELEDELDAIKVKFSQTFD